MQLYVLQRSPGCAVVRFDYDQPALAYLRFVKLRTRNVKRENGSKIITAQKGVIRNLAENGAVLVSNKFPIFTGGLRAFNAAWSAARHRPPPPSTLAQPPALN